MYDRVYVWQGKKADVNEKRSAMQIAQAHIDQAQINTKISIIRLP